MERHGGRNTEMPEAAKKKVKEQRGRKGREESKEGRDESRKGGKQEKKERRKKGSK